MAECQRVIHLTISHFQIGDYVEYQWFRGEVIGVNANALTHVVRVREVLRQGAGRTVGSTVRMPFNQGREVQTPEARNIAEAAFNAS